MPDYLITAAALCEMTVNLLPGCIRSEKSGLFFFTGGEKTQKSNTIIQTLTSFNPLTLIHTVFVDLVDISLLYVA